MKGAPALLLLSACVAQTPEEKPASAPVSPSVPRPALPDVLLVSLDTTRADALGPWGDPRARTPHHDAVAGRGTVFRWAFAQAPTTLASHAIVFTGRDPHETTVVRNGYELPPGLPMLAERLTAAGYQALGVVAATALAGETGIGRGFEVWDEQLERRKVRRHESDAASVTRRARALLAARDPSRPTFLFVHYYDAHAPFEAPAAHVAAHLPAGGALSGREGELDSLGEAVRAGRADPAALAEVQARYLAEVSYVDEQLGVLLQGLDPSRTLIAAFGDHGEMLGEEPKRPFGHGPDLDPPATHVPLYLAGPGVPTRTVDSPVALQDLATTLLARVGLPPLGTGVDLLEASSPVRFLEASQPGHDEPERGWNNLGNERGVLTGQGLLLACPARREPAAFHPLVPGPPGDLAGLTAMLQAWDARAPPWRAEHMSAAMREGLEALGYLDRAPQVDLR